jgi:hypothetical protein
MGNMVINGTIEVKPGGESNLRTGNEVKVYKVVWRSLDLGTASGQQ